MIKKILLITCAAIMLFLTIISAVNAQTGYYASSLVYPTYYYYQDSLYQDNENTPIVTGPFPRYYLANNDLGIDEFHPDDFNHFDEFVGYKDLDVFNCNGQVDVIRNPNAQELDLSQLPSGIKVATNVHVYGFIPAADGGCAMYRKHYGHEHAWELESDYDYGYDYNDNNYDYGYGYFTPFYSYRTRPVYTQPCQSIGTCQATRSYNSYS